MEKHIYFVRHGESDSNVDDVHRGADALLTERGREQATLMAQQIAHVDPSVLFSSDFPRALDTADAVAKITGLSTKQNEMFGEWREPTAFFGKHKDDPEAHKVLTQIETTFNADYQHSDEERFAELTERARRALTFLEEYDAPRICVVTHGGFLRVLLGNMLFGDSFTKKHFMQSLNSAIKRIHVNNTSITHVTYSPEHHWTLVSWNDHKHLDGVAQVGSQVVPIAEKLV